MGSPMPFSLAPNLKLLMLVRRHDMSKYLASLIFVASGALASPAHAATPNPAPLRDEASMVLVGTALIGLGAALRRAA